MTSAHPKVRFARLDGSLSTCIAALLAAGSPAWAAAAQVTASPLSTLATVRANIAARAAATRQAAANAGGVSKPSATAGNVVVTSCGDDGGFDTLRHAVLVANNGDTVDLSGLACGTITLQSGAISVGLESLTIAGPGAGKLTIDGANADRVFNHSGVGTLTFNDVTVAHGAWAADKAYGGCIYSKGNVSLNRATVTACTAIGQTESLGGGILAFDGIQLVSSTLSNCIASAEVGVHDSLSAVGGAAFGAMQMRLIQSVVSGNSAHSPVGKSYGGGVFSPKLTVKYSTLANNTVTSANTLDDFGSGGAIATTSASNILASTIDHNSADAFGGLLILDDATATASITMSTISSNVGTLGVGALSSEGNISILGSTIAFNTSGATAPMNVSLAKAAAVTSTIIADNTPVDFNSGQTVTGGKNLLKILYPGTLVPADTVALDPNLQPLGFNGGSTRTHALGNGSPAINAGSNGANYDFDQRGPTYRRAVGAADIGAYEVDTDHIFGTSLEYPLAL